MLSLALSSFAGLLTVAVTSSSVSKGLSAPMAIAAVIVGHVLVCIPAMLDG
jgi:cytosine/uracil/thiamine/allantoin permease